MDLVEANFGIDQRHPWELTRMRIALNLIEKYSPNTPRALLDVGSGDAFIAHSLALSLKETQSHCIDIEYTDIIKEELYSLYNNKDLHLYSSLLDFSNRDISCDFVTLMDVIEHVPDDIAFLKELISKGRIKAKTKFLITVPAYQSLFTHHDVILKHYRRYNLRQLKANTTAAGLTHLTGGYFFTSLLGPRLLTWISEKIGVANTENHNNLGNWEGSPLISNLLEFILYADYKVNSGLNNFNLRLPGLSCYAICELDH